MSRFQKRRQKASLEKMVDENDFGSYIFILVFNVSYDGTFLIPIISFDTTPNT